MSSLIVLGMSSHSCASFVIGFFSFLSWLSTQRASSVTSSPCQAKSKTESFFWIRIFSHATDRWSDQHFKSAQRHMTTETGLIPLIWDNFSPTRILSSLHVLQYSTEYRAGPCKEQEFPQLSYRLTKNYRFLRSNDSSISS